MKIGVIGTINRDTIKFPDGGVKRGWGGMLYNLRTLSYLIGDKADIYPACNVGADCYRPIMKILRGLPGINTDYVNRVPENNNHCFLTYINTEIKHEILKSGVKPLKFSDIEPLTDCDIILLNYISGRDIYLKSLQKFRRNFGGLIYTDIHSLTLGKKSGGRRYFRRPPNWPQVVESLDIIQMNRLELSILTEQKTDTSIDSIKRQAAAFKETLKANGISSSGKTLIVTDGSRGCYLSFNKGSKEIFHHIPPRRALRMGDATGCGDCFSAGYITGLMRGKDPLECCKCANRAAFRRLQGRAVYRD